MLPTAIKQAGTIGKNLKYFHRFRDLDAVLIDSSRENEGLIVSNEHATLPPREGVSLLKVWLDNWRPYGIYNYVSRSPLTPKEPGLALILSGPIVGCPMSGEYDSSSTSIPIMLELDRETQLTITYKNIFHGKEKSTTFFVPARRPYVHVIGPLEYENRYSVSFDQGLRKPMSFVLSSHISPNESNVVILHCDRDVTEKSFCSDFMYDVVKRNKVSALHVVIAPKSMQKAVTLVVFNCNPVSHVSFTHFYASYLRVCPLRFLSVE